MHESPLRRPGATDGPGPLSPLERKVLDAVLAGEAAALQVLRAQLAKARVLSRTHSGVGYVARLTVPEDRPALDPAQAEAPRLRPVTARHAQLAEPAEFILQLRNGRLAVLEAFCFAGGWPSDEAGFVIELPAGTGR